MRRVILAMVLSTMVTYAAAQQQAPQSVTIPGPLMQAVVNHLMVGGTISDGQHLAQQIVEASQEPAKAAAAEKDLRAKIEAEMKAPKPAPTPAPDGSTPGHAP